MDKAYSVHPLKVGDFEIAGEIMGAAFGRPENWSGQLAFNHRLQPDGYWGAYHHGGLVGLVGVIVYSTKAYVGLLAVHPDHQQKGIGLALMQYLLRWLEEKNIADVVLDASDQGKNLYNRLGFVSVEHILTYERKPTTLPCDFVEVLPITSSNIQDIARFDKDIFGADRGRVLQALHEAFPHRGRFYTSEGRIKGYLICQEKRIGPWVMHGREGAECLLKTALSLPYDGAASVVVPGNNHEVKKLLTTNGFELTRTHYHMIRGSGRLIGQRKNIFGQTSLSLG